MDNGLDTYRVVVGHDLTAAGNEALEQAVALVRRIPGSEVHVVHALSRPSPTNVAGNDRRLEAALGALKARVQAVLARDPSVKARVHVRFGKVAETILEVAIDYDADVVLVGTHGRRGLDRVGRRSVAEKLVRTAPLPVLVAHAKDFTGLPLTARAPRSHAAEAHPRARALSELVVLPEHGWHASGVA